MLETLKMALKEIFYLGLTSTLRYTDQKKNSLKEEDRKAVRRFLVERRVEAIPVANLHHFLLVVVGKCGELTREEIRRHQMVERLIDIDRPYKLASLSKLKTKTKFKRY